VFEWNARKAVGNEAKHGVSFEEASTAFHDPLGLDGEDIEHSVIESRRLRLAKSVAGRILVNSYTRREHGGQENIRLISARPANRKEKKR
jgi:uncharacterized DUF497 family protein